MITVDQINNAVYPASANPATIGDDIIFCDINASLISGAHMEEEVLSLHLDNETVFVINAILDLINRKCRGHSMTKCGKKKYLLLKIKNKPQKVALPLRDLQPIKAILMRKDKKELRQILDNLLPK